MTVHATVVTLGLVTRSWSEMQLHITMFTASTVFRHYLELITIEV